MKEENSTMNQVSINLSDYISQNL